MKAHGVSITSLSSSQTDSPGTTVSAPSARPFWMTTEDLPDPENRVTLDRDGNIVLAYRPNNEEAHRQLTARLKEAMRVIG